MAAKLKEVESVVAAGPYQPNAGSLTEIGIPKWYADAKFGIFIHWGGYSVPAFGSEWYPRKMYDPTTKEFKHHAETYGPVSELGYKDFLPLMKAEEFDAEAWASLFKESGARYIMPVAEHHDGFSLYDTKLVTLTKRARFAPSRFSGVQRSSSSKAQKA